ncbi:outer membrane beta-barrel protein [Flavobacterium hiemivividum]|uniref:Uncharacterized protein n=1 Tax=Flavobacterium hiemivividum TaxID=2541734 RepID=A0A4R5D3N9_9FLAO|nr:outer membrane beta-barrel protein [Flavobacterium hiemivividum]TDE04895.1 hypothetical protein E0F98_06010 [Flavobacterium hiemivividum]
MKNKKNIDRLFQEKFKDFETEPNEQAWLNIKAALQEENKERKLLPIWFKYTGMAAALFFCFFALNTIFKTSNEPKSPIILDSEIVITPPLRTDSIATKSTNDAKESQPQKTAQIALSDDEQIKGKKLPPASKKRKQKSKANATVHKNKATAFQKEPTFINGTTAQDQAITEESNPRNASSTASLSKKDNNEIILKDKKDSKIAESNIEAKQSGPNELEELLKAKEQVVVNKTKNKWEIVPNIAAMYINTKASGSAIDPQLSTNNKTADNGFSVGIGINYALSNKLALRSGINAFSVGYNTNDVAYAAGLNTHSLANVNYTSNESIEILNQASFNGLTLLEKDLQKTSTGSINQKMGYYEIPVELSYAILDKKFGINIIGGVSTLFLNQNEISLIAPQANVKLGEASNLNTIHFSTNFGLGFEYEFVKSFQINFEPMIKYQLNSYSNDSSNFNPIYIGLYSGISYRF